MLTKRLDKLLQLIPQCDVLADVGCDHGYVGIQALVSGRAQHVVFVDVSRPSLCKARNNCPQQLLDRAQFVCRNGLGDIKADCAVIAGMGGMEIISILQNAAFLPQNLVLQPNLNAPAVRDYLAQRYVLRCDAKLLDGKFYDMILAELYPCPPQLSALQREFGLTNLAEPTDDFRLYLARERAKLTKILQSCNDERVRTKLDLVRQAVAAIGGQL